MSKEEDSDPEQISLEYGNIIRIIASKNANIHEKTFFIEYLDESKIKLLNVSSLKTHVLQRDAESGKLSDESIEEIQILSRAESPSFARQRAPTTEVIVPASFFISTKNGGSWM